MIAWALIVLLTLILVPGVIAAQTEHEPEGAAACARHLLVEAQRDGGIAFDLKTGHGSAYDRFFGACLNAGNLPEAREVLGSKPPGSSK